MEWIAASIWIMLCFVDVCHLLYPLFNSPLLLAFEKLWCMQVMVRCLVRYPPTGMVLMERIVYVARLHFGMLPIGVENCDIRRVFLFWLRRSRCVPSPWRGRVARRLRFLRRMTVFRTSGVGKFGCNSEVGVVASKCVYVCPKSLTLSLSLSFGCVGDWREQFLADVVLVSSDDVGLSHFVHDALARTFG